MIDIHFWSSDHVLMRLVLLTLALSVFTVACPAVDEAGGHGSTALPISLIFPAHSSPGQDSFPTVSGDAAEIHLTVEPLRPFRLACPLTCETGVLFSISGDSTGVVFQARSAVPVSSTVAACDVLRI